MKDLFPCKNISNISILEKITDIFRKTEFRSVAYIYAKFKTLRVAVCLQHDCVNMFMNKLEFFNMVCMYMN